MIDETPSSTTAPVPAALLKGVRVLDLTNVLSGPYCTFQLALLGADVIKIERPGGGDLARQLGASTALNEKLMGVSFLAQNAGKKSISLNLKSDQGVELLKSLIKTADVIVENFRPDVMKRLGLGYDELKRINPGLIYCAITGFGQEGPLKSNPAYDQIIQGMSGVMSVTGDAQTAPLRVGYPVCDTLGGLVGAFAIVSALYERKTSGVGRFIDVSMLDSAVSALGWVASNYLIAGVEAKPIGNENMTSAPSGAFKTSDGLINIAANKQDQFEALCRLIEREDLVRDDRFAKREDRKANRYALNEEINKALSMKPALEWETLLNEAGVPAGRVLSVPEVLAHPQIKERRLLQEIGGADGDATIKVVKSGFRMNDSEPAASAPPPKLGQHNSAVFEELGLSDQDLEELRKEGVI